MAVAPWKGTIGVPLADDGTDRRLLITEIETFPSDMVAGDAPYMFSPRDHLREPIVYADAFEL